MSGSPIAATYLLDTHVVLWLLGAPDRVPAEVRTALSDRRNSLLVSAASALEVATKVRIGKLDAPTLPATFAHRVEQLGAEPLPISVEHALLAGSMTWPNRDPFDRILAAQSVIEAVTLVTVDRTLVDLVGLRSLSW